MQEESQDVISIAERQRHLFLLRKIKDNKTLTKTEIAELGRLEKKAKQQKNLQEAQKAKAESKYTVKQQKFIDSYDGNIKKAAEKAGLSYDYARRLVTKPHILEAIKNRQETEERPKTIATRQQRQEFWTEVMNDVSVDMKDRLRASELLGRSEADFTDNVNQKFPEGCGVLAVPVQMDKKQWLRFVKQNQNKNQSPK